MHPARFELSSLHTPPETEVRARYELRLLNRSGSALRDFRLGVSGPGRIAEGAQLENGTIVSQLSTWCEIAPPQDFELPDGEIWTVSTSDLASPFRHWTDGAAGAMLIHADSRAEAVLVSPCRSAASTTPYPTGVMPLPVPIPAPAAISVIPWPERVELGGFRTAPAGISPETAHPVGQEGAQAFAALSIALFPGEGLSRTLEEGGIPILLTEDRQSPPEGYRLGFEPDRVRLTASTATGFLYGLITLGQMLRGARHHPRSFAWPTAGEITDQPALGWRGCHLDVARRFYGTGEIAQFLRILAWNKLNRFHWHLSDDEGFRVELAGFQSLTDNAAWQGHGLSIPPLLGSGPERSGGVYSAAAISELVNLGESLGIAIVPEIDLPGHCHALLRARPELRDPGETGVYHSVQAFPNNCLNPAVEAVYETLEAMLGELADLFPARWFHIGGDEVPADAWSGSPLAQDLLRRLGSRGTPELQGHFLRRISAFMRSRGKIVGAWEEGAQGGGIPPEGSYLVGWHSVEITRKLAAAGYDVVSAPGQAYYLDMAQSEDWHEPGASWAGWSSPETTYAFDPAAGWSEGERARLLGVQACIWSEPMGDRAVFDRLVFPRLSAIAETGWTAPPRKDFSRFIATASLMPSLYGRREQQP